MKLTTRDGQTFEVANEAADDHRLVQMQGRWMPAGEVCCRLGIANPLGFGRGAELAEVRLVEVK